MKYRFVFLFLFVIFRLGAIEKYQVSICAIFRNEARFLKEWIEYHRIIGVEHFYLFNNLSEDNYQKILDPYITKGIVELFEWPYEAIEIVDFNSKVQCAAYNKVLNEKKTESTWIAFIDTDEFIVPIEEGNLINLLNKYTKFGGLAINWQFYGTSGIQRVPTEKLMIELLFKKLETNSSVNYHVKSIVQSKKASHFENPHYVYYLFPFFQVNENKEGFSGPFSPYVSVQHIRINHYSYRDEDFFFTEKKRRILVWGKDADPKPIEGEIMDSIILKYVPELEQRMKEPLP